MAEDKIDVLNDKLFIIIFGSEIKWANRKIVSGDWMSMY